ncbi:unnamed protein product, partial [marine sediment metagenome]
MAYANCAANLSKAYPHCLCFTSNGLRITEYSFDEAEEYRR